MEELKTIAKITSQEQVDKMVEAVHYLIATSSERNIEINELTIQLETEESIKSRFRLPWQPYELSESAIIPTIPQVKILGVKVNIQYVYKTFWF